MMCSMFELPLYEFLFLQDNIMIKKLSLHMNGIADAGAMYFGEALKKNDTLSYLDLTFNRISDQGATYLAKGLEKNEALHQLLVRAVGN